MLWYQESINFKGSVLKSIGLWVKRELYLLLCMLLHHSLKIFTSPVNKILNLNFRRSVKPILGLCKFVPRQESSETNLACFLHHLSEVIDDRGHFHVMYIDFSKAFNAADISILIHIRCVLLIFHFLTYVNSVLSKWKAKISLF